MIIFDSNKNSLFDPCNLNLVGSPKKALMIFDDDVWEDYVIKSDHLKTIPI